MDFYARVGNMNIYITIIIMIIIHILRLQSIFLGCFLASQWRLAFCHANHLCDLRLDDEAVRAELDMDWIHPWIGLGHGVVILIVIFIVIALSDCQRVQIFRLSFDVNCCITNWLLFLLLFVIHVIDCMHQFKMLNRFLLHK